MLHFEKKYLTSFTTQCQTIRNLYFKNSHISRPGNGPKAGVNGSTKEFPKRNGKRGKKGPSLLPRTSGWNCPGAGPSEMGMGISQGSVTKFRCCLRGSVLIFHSLDRRY
jgi:hypothetical protein